MGKGERDKFFNSVFGPMGVNTPQGTPSRPRTRAYTAPNRLLVGQVDKDPESRPRYSIVYERRAEVAPTETQPGLTDAEARQNEPSGSE